MYKKPLVTAILAVAGSTSWANNSPTEAAMLDLAYSHLAQHQLTLNLSSKDVNEAQLLSQYRTQHNGISHLVFRQHVNGIEVAGGDIQMNLDRHGKVINTHNFFISDGANKANDLIPDVPADQAILMVAEHLNIESLTPTYRLAGEHGLNRAATFEGQGISKADIPVKLVYQADHNQQLKLAWDMQIQEGDNWWSIQVDADTGQVLSQHNWSAHASYDVIPMPNESPAETSFLLETVTDPADALASPFGWHDTDGVEGAEFTDTNGNNVFAQEDRDGNNIGGNSPDGGVDLEFFYPWDPLLGPEEAQNLEASVVNLFYWNNIVHDVMYYYGFDEVAGNFQENNYGNGGSGSDPVIADAQDGSGTNNANFGTPPDGQNPRMQMFQFTSSPDFIVNTPIGIAGQYASGSGFGGAHTPEGLTGDLELVDDGTDTSSDACEELVGFTPGNIALIDRGTCQFGLKALNAQNAGAIAAVIVNNQGDEPNNMAGGDFGNQVTIRNLSVGQADGDLFKAELLNGLINVTMVKENADRDSDFDSLIIIHEYGHGISNRLTGGPSNTSCLGNEEQMGEGWSDFFSLVMTAKPSQQATDLRPVGTYATQSTNGIREFPYTTDMNVNLHTYADVGSVSIPHGVGSVWTAMLWEMYWNLVEKHGFDADVYAGVGGNNMALQLVIDGLKLQPCNPSFETGRDAILLADQQNNNGDNQCEIWQAFAKRGLGVSANAGSEFSVGDESEAFDLPVECQVDTDLIFIDGFE